MWEGLTSACVHACMHKCIHTLHAAYVYVQIHAQSCIGNSWYTSLCILPSAPRRFICSVTSFMFHTYLYRCIINVHFTQTSCPCDVKQAWIHVAVLVSCTAWCVICLYLCAAAYGTQPLTRAPVCAAVCVCVSLRGEPSRPLLQLSLGLWTRLAWLGRGLIGGRGRQQEGRVSAGAAGGHFLLRGGQGEIRKMRTKCQQGQCLTNQPCNAKRWKGVFADLLCYSKWKEE